MPLAEEAVEGVWTDKDGRLVAVAVLGLVVFAREVRALKTPAVKGLFSRAVAVLLRLCRERKGWTWTQLAEHSHVARQSLVNWEQALQLPRLDKLRPLCTAMGVRLGDLVNAAEEVELRIAQF